MFVFKFNTDMLSERDDPIFIDNYCNCCNCDCDICSNCSNRKDCIKHRNSDYRNYSYCRDQTFTKTEHKTFYTLFLQLIYVCIMNLKYYFDIIVKSTNVFVVMQITLSFILYFVYGKHHIVIY